MILGERFNELARDVAGFAGVERLALTDTRAHEEASLSDGEIIGDEIECPLRGGPFEIRKGLPAAFPVVTPAKMYPVRVDDGDVQIAVMP
jgi:nitrite reductase/ring-hydroxylating ferredoxin subunit